MSTFGSLFDDTEEVATFQGAPSRLSSVAAVGLLMATATSLPGATILPVLQLPDDESTATVRQHDEAANVDSSGVCLPTAPSELVSVVLEYHSLCPSRISKMPEGSNLFEFFGNSYACVEVYPTNEIVVVVKNGHCRDLYELTTSDVSLIVPILKNVLRPSL